MSGAWVFICGPSGVGKDSVIAAAQQALQHDPNVVFSRRWVTRPAQTGSDHDPVTGADFLELVQTRQLSWHWSAHGFDYGIARCYAADVQAGRRVVVNGSRAHVNQLARTPAIRVVQITADPAQLAARLKLRGRDTAGAVAERLARNALWVDVQAACVIVNDRTVALAGQQLADFLTGPGCAG